MTLYHRAINLQSRGQRLPFKFVGAKKMIANLTSERTPTVRLGKNVYFDIIKPSNSTRSTTSTAPIGQGMFNF